PRDLRSFPTRRSSDLVVPPPPARRSLPRFQGPLRLTRLPPLQIIPALSRRSADKPTEAKIGQHEVRKEARSAERGSARPQPGAADRKSTRLNSSHVKI